MTKIEQGIVKFLHRFFEVDEVGLSMARVALGFTIILLLVGIGGANDLDAELSRPQ